MIGILLICYLFFNKKDDMTDNENDDYGYY